MSDGKTRSADFPAGESVAVLSGGSGFVAILAVVVAAGAASFALFASASAKPVLLTVMAVLAMLGVFFLFAVAAGHVRLSERVSEADLARGIAERLDSAVLITNRQGAPLFCNAAWIDLAGQGAIGAVPLIDQRVSAGTPAAESVFRLTRSALQRERRCEMITIEPQSGSPRAEKQRIVRLSVRPLELPSQESQLGPLTLWQAIDMTDERRAQKEGLEALSGRLAVYDAAPVGFLAAADDGSVSHINETLQAWLAGDAGEAVTVGKLSDIMSEESARLLEQTVRLAETKDTRLDLEIGVGSGKRIPVTAMCRRAANVEAGGYVCGFTLREVSTDQGAGERRTAEIRFARLFQSAPFGIATLSAQGRIVSANAAFGRMLLDPRSVEGRHAVDLLCPTEDAVLRSVAESAIQQVLAGHVNVTPVEVTVGPQGEFTRRVFLSPIAQGTAREAAVLFVIDATEQKALENKFAQSQKMEAVGKLAGGIAHDFNNVLTAIIGFSDLLLQTHRPTDAAYKDIMNIKQSANRAAGLVRQLLAFSRRQTLQTEVLQLGEVITDLSALLTRAIGEKIDLKIITGRDLAFVKADKTQFEQVIINLAVNGGDAMPNGGKLTIRTRNVSERESLKAAANGLPKGEYVLVEVEDTGTGMSPEVMSKIFEPFFTTKGVGKGTGLGLSTVYGIVKQTGGYIIPDSTIGKGTTFRVYLPRHDVDEAEAEAAAQKNTKKERPGDLTGSGRVLLVEDEDIVRSFAVRALKRQGYEVLEASTGVEALEIMNREEGRIDIVVSDVVMPEMDGPTLLKELRKTNPDMKIIFVSGYPDDAFKKSLDPNQSFAFLPKPFSLPQLAAKVKEQLTG